MSQGREAGAGRVAVTERRPAEAFHPSVYIWGELAERGWTLQDLCVYGECDTAVDRLAWEIYMTVGPEQPDLYMGEGGAAQLAEAFGTGAEVWTRMEESWRAWYTTQGDDAVTLESEAGVE